ncbi:MAG: CNP1-like family protein [Burkholderiales bacterium]
MKGWLALGVALAGCASGPTSDWERQQEGRLPPAEMAAPLPPFPRRADLVEFDVAATSEFRFFIDAGSLSVGPDGVVRYALVARSDAGAENVSYEGMRCRTGEVRIYAIGHDGRWGGKPGEWRAIVPRSVQRWHYALYREYFCPHKQPIASPREGVDALQRGGHPLTTPR